MYFDLSRVPAVLLVPFAVAAREVAHDPEPTRAEADGAAPVLDWAVATSRWGTPLALSLTHGLLDARFADHAATALLARRDGLVRSPWGWSRLLTHATERDPARVATILSELEATCAALRAALLAERRP